MQKASKSCPKSNKSPDLVTLLKCESSFKELISFVPVTLKTRNPCRHCIGILRAQFRSARPFLPAWSVGPWSRSSRVQIWPTLTSTRCTWMSSLRTTKQQSQGRRKCVYNIWRITCSCKASESISHYQAAVCRFNHL